MSKKDIIKVLIDAGNSFDDVVKLSKAKASYVKSTYTKLGLNWQDEPKEVEDVKEITKAPEVEKEAIEPEAPAEDSPSEGDNEDLELGSITDEPKLTLGTLSVDVSEDGTVGPIIMEPVDEEDIETKEEDKEEPEADEPEAEEEVEEPQYKIVQTRCKGLLIAANIAKMAPSLKARSQRYREKANAILINSDFATQNMVSLNCIYTLIRPVPNAMNCTRQIFKLQRAMKELFKAYRASKNSK